MNKLDQNAATVLVSNPSPAPTKIIVDPQEGPSTTVHVSPAQPKLDKFVVTAIEQELATNNQGRSAEEELAATRIILGEVKRERDEMKTEISSLLDQMHVRSTGKSRLALVEKQLSELTETNRELMTQNRELNDNIYRHGKTISDLEISGAQVKQSLMEVQEQLTFAKDEAERVRAELANYRTRAQSSLQMKERIIDELRSSSGNSSLTTETPICTLSELEIEQLKNERNDYSAEVATMKLKMAGYQEHINKLEERIKIAGEESTRNLTRLTDELARVEKERKGQHQEVTLLNAELQAVRTQSEKWNQDLTQQLYDKDQEIAGLRKRTNTFQETGGNLDHRIKSLTQSLIQKQTTLEEITADRNALRIQLEKVESQFQQIRRDAAEQSHARGEHVVQHMTDDDKAQLPLFIQENNPFDNRLAKRMKRMIRASDRVGALLGGFLRRYPLLRILFLLYTVLLHVWVMLVLRVRYN